MRILRHTKFAITMEIYTQVPTRPPRMRSGGSAMPWAMLVLTFPTMTSRPLLLYAAAVHAAQVFGNRVELRGLEPLTFWLQTIFLAHFYVA